MDLSTTPHYRFWLIPDYDENHSQIILNINHGSIDGVQGLGLVFAISDNYDHTALPRVPALTPLQTLLSYILLPLGVLIQTHRCVLQWPERSCIKRPPDRELDITCKLIGDFNAT